MELGHPKGLVRVTVHASAPARRLFFGALLVVLYSLVLKQVYETMGEPRSAAIAQMNAIDPTLTMTEDEYAEYIQNDEVKEEVGDDSEGLDYFAERHKDENGDERPLPSPYLPNAWAAASLMGLMTFHALFHLMCHWVVSFKVAVLFSPASRMEAGAYVCVTPHAHRGKAAICPVQRSPRTQRLGFEFQRQKYEYVEDKLSDSDSDVEETVGDVSKGFVRVVRMPDSMPVSKYINVKSGLADSEEVADLLDLYGKNSLSIAQPKFFSLLKEQLVSPLAAFQFFCAILWMLDEYWQYTAFTLVSIVMMEAGTAFQRLRTLGTLNGMTSKPSTVKVLRMREWVDISTADLLPGDIVSLKLAKADGGNKLDKKASPKPKGSDVVPCDCLLLRGSAVVNEATLTGESVPQMKDSLSRGDDDERCLDTQGQDRVHVLFSGTSLVSVNAGLEGASTSGTTLPATPDGGCLCYVLRTGFSSSQGELIQMIEFSTQKVSADSKETFAALLILLVFALVAAGYVLKRGLEKGDRTTHELLLKCVIIITSVVPRQLPMQMALAVNTALMALMKAGVFCSEPYRVPFAGKITHCLFDKTGTLTTDQLVPVGIVNNDGKAGAKTSALVHVPVKEASLDCAMVLGACHSLVHVDGVGVVGDPIEIAGMRGVEWQYRAQTQSAHPTTSDTLAAAATKLRSELEGLKEGKSLEDGRKKLVELEAALEEAKMTAARHPIKGVRILQRHHFSSQLQRMSVVCQVEGHRRGKVCLVKGSPEALRSLLTAHARPPWFDATYRSLAEQGMRVLALGMRWVDDEDGALKAEGRPREWVERDLTFVGFIAFACKTRADSSTVIKALSCSDHKVLMLTGDAPLTALHVAREVTICKPARSALMLVVEGTGSHEKAVWLGATGADAEKLRLPFDPSGVAGLADQYDLVVTEAAWEIGVANCSNSEVKETLWRDLGRIAVFARMSPQGKARVIRALQSEGKFVLMCGDGGNDVGALKQADVGLALLSGYGNTNTTGVAADSNPATPNDTLAEEELNRQQKTLAKRAKESAELRKRLLKEKQAELTGKQQEWLQEEMAARAARGEDTGVMAHMSALKNCVTRMRTELAEYTKELNQKHGNVFDDAKDGENGMDALLGDMDDGLPVVRPGDASVAAPFTSRVPSVRSAVDLIRQGRCTLLSSLQQQQIMMLECVISAYTLSALSLEGARSSERQMMASGMLLMVASVAFSYSSPVDRMDRVRPIRSLFHPAIFLSIVGQALIHLTCMVYAVHLATETMGPEKLAEVVEFHKKAKAGTLEPVPGDEEDMMAEFMALWTTPFKPNLMNTVVFLVETSQIVAVLFVNYKGRPWMKGVMENHALFLSIFLCAGGVAACAWGVNPEFNELIHLEPFPDDAFRWKVVSLVAASLVGTFVWDRIVTLVCAPDIFKAMMAEAMRTRPKDLVPIVSSFGKVVGGLVLLSTANIFVLLFLWWVWRQRRQNAAE